MKLSLQKEEKDLARLKYKTLTEQMFYILICLKEECCGIDIMEMVAAMTDGRITIGPGTLYALLGDFVKQGFIRETAVEGRKRSYILTDAGRMALKEEYERLKAQVVDYEPSRRHQWSCLPRHPRYGPSPRLPECVPT